MEEKQYLQSESPKDYLEEESYIRIHNTEFVSGFVSELYTYIIFGEILGDKLKDLNTTLNKLNNSNLTNNKEIRVEIYIKDKN